MDNISAAAKLNPSVDPDPQPVWCGLSHRIDTATGADAARALGPTRARRSRPARTDRLLSVLLPGIADEVNAGSALLRPLWAAEAACRAANLRRLVLHLERQRRLRGASPLVRRLEHALATDLASLYRCVAVQPEHDIVPCSAVLREVVGNLVALFEHVAGLELRTDIERLALPGYKRRALVLAAAELVARALVDGAEDRCMLRLIVSVSMISSRDARLIVADDGDRGNISTTVRPLGAAAALAELLEGTLGFPAYNWAGTVAEIRFPVRA